MIRNRVITTLECNFLKANLVFLGTRLPNLLMESRYGLLEKELVRVAAPEANVFGGIKSPKNAYSGYKFY